MSAEQVLKTDPAEFDAVWIGKKRFEIRFNDRNFECGDSLFLLETKHSGERMKSGKPLIYTRRVIEAVVIHVMLGPRYGLKEGWAILSTMVLSKYKLSSQLFNEILRRGRWES
jgi:hypothetical protein